MRLVGVTAGLGTARMLTWIGSSRTAPLTPAGVVAVATSRPARKAPRRCIATHQKGSDPVWCGLADPVDVEEAGAGAEGAAQRADADAVVAGREHEPDAAVAG